MALLFACFPVAPVLCQELPQAPSEPRPILRMVPQEFISHTLRLELEIPFSEKSSLQISPGITSAENTDNYISLRGAGLELTKKSYLWLAKSPLSGFYGAINASYHHYQIEDFYSYNQYGYPLPGQEEEVNRWAGNLLLGYQFIIKDAVAIDLFAGGGIRAGRRANSSNTQQFNNGILDPRYNGIAPKAGVSIGVVL